MSSNPSQNHRSYTPPKGEPTPSQARAERTQRQLSTRQVNLQWAAVIIVGLVIFGLVVVFGSGTGGDFNQVPVGGHG